MDHRTLLRSLGDADWQKNISVIESKLKEELQGSKGFIRHLRSSLLREADKNRESFFDALEKPFYTNGIDNLDERINAYATEMLKFNQNADLTLQYDFFSVFPKFLTNTRFPFLFCVSDLFTATQSSESFESTEKVKDRLSAILLKVINQSLSQSNKSNAGVAGERIVKAVLSACGLIKDVHYRTQYKSKSGSDTDFALPYVEDYNDSKVEVLIAAQMSTNDRARLTSSELKSGVVSYVVTGNGLSASTKSLKDIGSQIIETYMHANIRLVCYSHEIQNEIDRLTRQMGENSNHSESSRLQYFKSSAISFTAFAKSMKRFSQFRQTPQ